MNRSLFGLLSFVTLLSCGDASTPLTTITTGDATSGLSARSASNAGSASSVPLSATLTFGRSGVGSPFPPPSGHDASGHAYDKILPHVVNIAAGGSVTINIGPFHAAAVYDAGTRPEDISLDPSVLDDLAVPFPPGVLPDFIINDPTNRIAQGPPLDPAAPVTWTTPAGTFDTPGRYLVICVVVPHFANAKMYAYVNVH
jgi:hypothetical protein